MTNGFITAENLEINRVNIKDIKQRNFIYQKDQLHSKPKDKMKMNRKKKLRLE